MTGPARTRAPQALLSEAQKSDLDQAIRDLESAARAAEEARSALNAAACRIAEECGRGGASAVARHTGWSAQYVSALAAAHRAREKSAAA
ncbi:hypothetical protein ACIA6E_30085 [Streptomyces sp. NPDC051815]|uniref:hypothetical protein n=1 Tax=Streptomyces sp. NPDC051815 TaxID=3365674 RepID=UPI0037B2A81D